MEDFVTPSSLLVSPDNRDGKEIKIVPSSAAESPTTSATRGLRNVPTFLFSSAVFCLFIRLGLPRLMSLFKSNSTVPKTQNVLDPTPGRLYDVFLNHLGTEVKGTLASIIYHWLDDTGIRVFFDEELQTGEPLQSTIQHAISIARVHIAIFSKQYVESHWCLDELCLMLKSRAKIIPVYYDVHPYDLRWIGEGKGVYVRAFAKHQKQRRVPSQKLDEWKAALRRVSHMYGLELNGPQFNGDWGKLLKIIVNTVLKAVREVPLGSVEDPVGLDDAVTDFQNCIQCQTRHRKVLETQNVLDPTPDRPYDVFLNHQGFDVKSTLVSIIYRWLKGKGLRVFLDQEEFQAEEGLPPTIQQVISSASVHIAILSERYAECRWCLDKLCLMLKSGAKIIPVFYGVQPSNLRRIGRAFDRHQENRGVPSQKLDEWKAALQQVSCLNGFLLDCSQFYGDWGKILKKIVNAVSEAVNEKGPLGSVRDPVGLDDAVTDFQNFIQCQTRHRKGESVKIVGIVGFGGSGKTTLAEEFYNIQRASFAATSFLYDVRHAAAKNKLQSLQVKLLNDLVHISDMSIKRSSLSEGRAMLGNKLRSLALRVLIILDDIDDEKQVKDLLNKDALGSGSLIVMTSREEGVLRKSEADFIYKIKRLESNHALELFCRHAFQQPHPKTGFEDLAEKFCRKCGGFPLFLKVIGAHLNVCGEDDRSVWNRELEYTPDGIKNILKFSYERLGIEEKQMLLDVACFFVGEDKNMAIRLWNRSHGRASTCLQNLEGQCLVQVDDGNCLKLDDYMRDIAREIAKQESSCRFWHPNQLTDIRKQLKGRKEVRGMIAATGEFSYDLTHDSAFKEIELSELKFLSIKGDCFESRFGQQATNLMWLRWYDCPHTNIPSWLISMKHLTVLHIFGGILEKWEVCDTQLTLTELSIQRTRLSYVSISEDICPQLQHLDLSCNESLVEVEHLPTTLELLNLLSCTTLKRISTSFHLQKLKLLNIAGCRELEELPDLKHLTFLETLEASGCSKLQNTHGLEHLSKLQHLKVNQCSELGELPNLSALTSLETLEATGCSKLQNIRGLEHLSKLQHLKVNQCFELSELPNLSALTSLETLEASDCNKLQNIHGLEHLSKLQHLKINQCSELSELPNLSALTSLETLEASDCSKLQNIHGLEHLSKLQHLKVNQCSELSELPNLSALTSLETLEASDFSKLQNIHGLEHLSKLQHLKVNQCSELRELPNLSALTSLETLEASDCSKLQNIHGLEHLSKLQHLKVNQCFELGELPNLSALNSLERLEASGCGKLQTIQGLEYWPNLRIFER